MHIPDAQRARAAHDSFRSTGRIPVESLDSLIADSWKRSQSFGLAEDHRPEFDPLPRGHLEAAREAGQSLYSCARPVMETLYEQIVGTQSMIILTDSRGLILHALGDDDFLARAEKVALRPGVNWSEQSIGTNAVGTALASGEPTLVHGPEHFLRVNHCLTCSAVPIADPYGKTIGSLDVSGDWRSYQRHTLALVRMSGQLIENHLFSNAFADTIVLEFHSRPEFIGTLCQGMVAFQPDGTLLSANKSGLFQLGIGLNGLRSHTFPSLFGIPVSALMDHIRTHGNGLIPLNLPAGVRVMARARLGLATRMGNNIYFHLQDKAPRTFEAEPAAQRPSLSSAQPRLNTSGLSEHKSPSLASLSTGDSQVDAALAKIRKVVGRDIALLIQGETGTGKELLARAIHADSPRRNGPFVAVNCASIPESLIESELFGYEEGAFTGARKRGNHGKIVAAHGGTLFLDEIGDMPLALQARLLRVLQERVVTPLGSTKSTPIDVSIICATHRKLKELIARELFREDLYYRLNGLLITLPPLRMRSDLEAVVDRILQRELEASPGVRIAPDVLDLFRRHPWPGNCRQLANVLRTALVMADDAACIAREHLPDDFLEDLEMAAEPEEGGSPSPQPLLREDARLEDIEFTAIQRTLDATGGNVSATARKLGISRNTIYRKLRQGHGPH